MLAVNPAGPFSPLLINDLFQPEPNLTSYATHPPLPILIISPPMVGWQQVEHMFLDSTELRWVERLSSPVHIHSRKKYGILIYST